jgi:hypothetical protein
VTLTQSGSYTRATRLVSFGAEKVQSWRCSAWIVRAAQRVLPDSLFSEQATKRRGLVRRVLRRVGLSWVLSPIRRIVQAGCFLLFLWLFFYVCWPYTAAPDSVSGGWMPVECDGETGRTTLADGQTLDGGWIAGRNLHVTDESIEQESERYLGVFRLISLVTPNIFS